MNKRTKLIVLLQSGESHRRIIKHSKTITLWKNMYAKYADGCMTLK